MTILLFVSTMVMEYVYIVEVRSITTINIAMNTLRRMRMVNRFNSQQGPR